MQVSFRENEAIAFVESMPDGVLFEHFDSKWTFQGNGVVNHSPTKPFSVKRRMQEESCDFIVYEGDESDGLPVFFQHPPLAIGTEDITHIFCLLGHEVFGQKGMSKCTGLSPYFEQRIPIAGLILSNHQGILLKPWHSQPHPCAGEGDGE